MDSLTEKKRRVYLLDIIRGILIIYVVYYHFMYDLNDILGHDIPYLYSEWFSTIRDCMSGSLIFISGISCNFSRNNLKRGSRTLLIALALSIVTVVVMPSQTIIFGILHLLGMMMTLYGLGEYVGGVLFTKRNNTTVLNDIDENGKDKNAKDKKAAIVFDKKKMYIRIVFMLLFMFLFFACFDIYYGQVGFGSMVVNMPGFLYGGKNSFLYIMGFSQQLFSADYYPIIPWGFLFLAGAMVGYIFKCKNLPGFLYKNFCRPLAFIGRHTMIIYLVHQPLLFGIFMIVDALR